jgi:hypothetical protein
MKRLLIAITLAALTVASGGALASASPGHSTASHRFTDHLVGATVQTKGKRSVDAFTVSSSDAGPGASTSVTRSTSATTGTFTTVVYLGNGSVRTAGTYRISAPTATAPNMVSVTLHGHITGGTGIDKGATGTFHGTGTDNTKTKIQMLTVTGTITP